MVVNAPSMPMQENPGMEDDKTPIYLRIQRHFLERIAVGDLKVGDRLPTEMEIAKAFGTSRATVQSAMSRLVHEGWIEKQAGRGTFVANAGHTATIDLHDVRSFEEEVASHGDHVTYRLLHVGRDRASSDVAERLGIDEGTVIFTIKRLRLVGGNIIGMERRYFAPGITLDMPLEALDMVSTHELVEDHLKLDIGRMDVSIRAIAAAPDVGLELGVESGSPLLLRRHTMFSASEDVILFGEAFYRDPFAFRYTARAGHNI
jgi:GntR family transcriptional regulator